MDAAATDTVKLSRVLRATLDGNGLADDGNSLTDFLRDHRRDRGDDAELAYFYGLAYGMLLPAPADAVRERAYEVAEEAWRGWTTTPTRGDVRALEAA